MTGFIFFLYVLPLLIAMACIVHFSILDYEKGHGPTWRELLQILWCTVCPVLNIWFAWFLARAAVRSGDLWLNRKAWGRRRR